MLWTCVLQSITITLGGRIMVWHLWLQSWTWWRSCHLLSKRGKWLFTATPDLGEQVCNICSLGLLKLFFQNDPSSVVYFSFSGVLLACYLVFTTRMSADQAILFVRAKRPNSIQTRGQLLCVREFAQFLVPLRSVFSCAEPKASAITLSQYLTRQRHLLHGYEARQMKNVPKIVQLVCRVLVDIAANRQVVIEEEWLEIPDLTAEVEKTVSQQALQQLGKEMRGKGIPVLPCSSHPLSPPALQAKPVYDQPLISDNELDPLWRQQNVESPLRSSLSNNRSLSYSDSVLHNHGQRQHLENLKSNRHLIKHSLSHSSLPACNPLGLCDLYPQDIISSIQDPNTEARHGSGSPVLKKQLFKHKSLSLDLFDHGRKSHCDATQLALLTKRKLAASEEDMSAGNFTEVPLITLHSELSPEGRRLLVAKALAMELTDKDLTSKVTAWQVRSCLCFSMPCNNKNF